MADAFGKAGVDSPRFMAEMLLSHVLACDRLRLYTDADRPASAEELDRLRDLVKRALRHEPVQYLVGEAWFYGLRFRCDARALVPRECTGVIVRRVMEEEKRRGDDASEKECKVAGGEALERDEGPRTRAGDGRGPMIADVCTGSGCIAIALARMIPAARVVAADISREALALARENAELLGVSDRVEFREGDLLDPFAEFAGRLDYTVANPPYIPDDEWDGVAANVRGHEPEIALRGGADGMRFVRPILEEGPALLRPGGMILVEVASRRADEAREILAGANGITGATILCDQDGLARVVEGSRTYS